MDGRNAQIVAIPDDVSNRSNRQSFLRMGCQKGLMLAGLKARENAA